MSLKNFLLAALAMALLAVSPALAPAAMAGSITISVTGDASVGTKTKTFAVPDADVNRFVAWAKVNYATDTVPAPTTTQAMVAWAASVINAAKQAVVSSEKQVTVAAVPDPVWTAN